MNGNLDARGVQQRYTLALIGLLAGLVGTGLALVGKLPVALLFIPFMLAALGFFQAREKT